MNAFGFIAPWFLTLLPLGGVLLVYAYRKSGAAKIRAVASTFFLQHFKNQIQVRKRFRPPIHFWFELIALCGLVLALAGLFTKTPKQKVAVVIDSSLSMSAVSPAGTSLLELAKREAEQVMLSINDDAEFILFSTGGKLTPEPLTKLEAGQALNRIKWSYTESGIETALQTVVADPQFDRVIAFSDALLQEASAELLRHVRYTNVRASPSLAALQNVAITSAALTTESLLVHLRSFSSSDTPIKISLSDSAKEFKSISVTIPAKTELEVPLSTKDISQDHIFFQITLSALSERPEVDSLKADNTFWIVRDILARQVAIVSEKGSSTFGFETIPWFKSIALSGVDYEKQTIAYPAIFYRYFPSRLPLYSSLFILPSSAPNDTIYSLAPQPSNLITRWDTSHPVVSSVRLPLLQIPGGMILHAPGWARPIIFGPGGALAVAGEHHKARYVATGFELLPYDGSKSPTLSILTLNILQWFGLNNTTTPSLLAGTANEVPFEKNELHYIASAMGTDAPEIRSAGNKLIIPEVPGILATNGDVPKQQKALAVNFYAAAESNLLEPHSFSINSPVKTSTPATESQSPFERDLANVAFAFLLLDLLWRIFRSVGKRGGYFA